MLTGSEIKKQCELGAISIEPFDEKRINPNSYNLRLGDKLKVYKLTDNHDPNIVLDAKANNATIEIEIPDDGYILEPGVLYLGSTMEYTKCGDFIAGLDGRSSIGRLGICVHLTAGFGDIGFEGTWTLEITVIHPVKIYKGIEICQIYFERPEGDTTIRYHGKYQGQVAPTESRMHSDRLVDTTAKSVDDFAHSVADIYFAGKQNDDIKRAFVENIKSQYKV